MASTVRISQAITVGVCGAGLLCACGIGYHSPPPPPPFYSVLSESPQYDIDLHADVGQMSRTVNVRYRNQTAQPLKLRAPFFDHNDDNKFQLQNGCGNILAPGAACTVSIRYAAFLKEMEITNLNLCLQDSDECRTVGVFGWGHDQPVYRQRSRVRARAFGIVAIYWLAYESGGKSSPSPPHPTD